MRKGAEGCGEVGAEEITFLYSLLGGSDPHWRLISAIIFLGALSQSSLL